MSETGSTPVTLTHLRDLPRIEVAGGGQIAAPAVYRVGLGPTRLSAAFYPKQQSDALYVFFSGFVNRKLLPLPVFRRWEWHALVPGHALYLSDPTLEACEDLGLGWYIGDRHQDAMEVIAPVVLDVAQHFGISPRRIVFYGSSGGGFAALRALRWVPEAAAIAINPQTRLTAFRAQSLTNYLTRFFDGISKEQFAERHPTRNALVEALADNRNSAVVYVQNTADDHHVESHFPAFHTKSSGIWAPSFFSHQKLVLFEDAKGHDTAEPKAMLPDLTQAAAALQALRFG